MESDLWALELTMDAKSIVEQNPKIKLNSGQLIPQVGLGVYKLAGEFATPLILQAIEVGYRRIDTAAFYGNETEVGEAVRRSGLDRQELFVTTKIWKDDHGYDRALEAIDESLARLNIDYIDMLLIHWPSPKINKFVDTWAAFQKAQESGKIRGIGVSNFQPAHLETLLAAGGAGRRIQPRTRPGHGDSSREGGALVGPGSGAVQERPGRVRAAGPRLSAPRCRPVFWP